MHTPRCVLFSLVAVCSTSSVWAADPLNSEAIEPISWADFGWSLLPIVLILFLIWLAMRNHLRSYARSQIVQQTLAHYELVHQHQQRMEAIHERIAKALEKNDAER